MTIRSRPVGSSQGDEAPHRVEQRLLVELALDHVRVGAGVGAALAVLLADPRDVTTTNGSERQPGSARTALEELEPVHRRHVEVA